MKLLVDVGNSSIGWACLEDGEMGEPANLFFRRRNLPALLDKAWGELERPEAVVVSCVAGPNTAEKLSAWIGEHWDVEPTAVAAQAHALGVTNGYVAPAQLGADRWAALLAAHRHHPGAACIVDCGTAITIDAIAASGNHLGGLIIPGLQMMRDALMTRTGGIADVIDAHGSGSVQLLACDTRGGVEGGTLYSVVAFIDRVMNDVERELRTPVQCIVTGGDAERVMELLSGSPHHAPQLVLQGLALIADELLVEVTP